MIAVITPTGGRPESLQHLAQYLNAQTVECFRWIVLDDCDPTSVIPAMRGGIDCTVIRPSWRWSPGASTQARSLIELIDAAGDHDLIVCEDDDVYLPQHVATMAAALQDAELVGQRVSHYWNAATGRYRAIPGRYHASLGTCAMRPSAAAALRAICARQSSRLDLSLWGEFAGASTLLDTVTSVGIKAQPGRGGIGIGHRDDFGFPVDVSVLRNLIGDYARHYT